MHGLPTTIYRSYKARDSSSFERDKPFLLLDPASNTLSFATMIFQAWLCAAHSIALRASTESFPQLPLSCSPVTIMRIVPRSVATMAAQTLRQLSTYVIAVMTLRCLAPRRQEASPYTQVVRFMKPRVVPQGMHCPRSLFTALVATVKQVRKSQHSSVVCSQCRPDSCLPINSLAKRERS